MSRRSHQKRKTVQKKKRNPLRRSTAPPPRQPSTVPSAHTFMRSVMLNFQTRETIAQASARLQPSLLRRDGKKIEQIEKAQTLDEVFELAPQATGLANHAWLARMRCFGSSAAPIIAERFNALPLGPHHKDRTPIEEKTIEALRWCEKEGIEPLLSCWDAFDDYGRSLACMVLGLVAAQQAANPIWAFYRHVETDRRENLFVGALWGLIDLQDPRAADALLELLVEGREFYELYGFLSRAGDRRAVLPLLFRVIEGNDQTRADAMWALTSIAYRIGRSGLIEELESAESSPDVNVGEDYEHFADRVYSYSASEAENHFALFYGRSEISVSELLQQQETLH
jgi:hypothetical protein